MIITTKLGVNVELSERLASISGYHKRYIKKHFPTISDWRLVDNNIDTTSESFPKVVEVDSIEFKDVNAKGVTIFVDAQECLVKEILAREIAISNIEKASALTQKRFIISVI